MDLNNVTVLLRMLAAVIAILLGSFLYVRHKDKEEKKPLLVFELFFILAALCEIFFAFLGTFNYQEFGGNAFPGDIMITAVVMTCLFFAADFVFKGTVNAEQKVQATEEHSAESAAESAAEDSAENEDIKNLEKLVEEKTKKITQMQDSIIEGIAEVVDNVDDSTGGHIYRTKNLVAIISYELLDEKVYDITEAFCKKVIKAAPLHDLGKMAVPYEILTKKGRFEGDEFAKMKTHAAKGGEIVGHVVSSVEDEEFKTIATNIATYHHERWDGKGYPEGKSGEDIPLEARIMALADVYDALASKRCYKESLGFEECYKIIEEGLGSQFDPKLKECFEKCEPIFEMYYETHKKAAAD